MNLYTYLMIKKAAGPRYASDATPEEIAEWTMNDMKGQQAIQQIPELQSQLDEAIDKNNRYYLDNSKRESDLQSQLRKEQQSNEALNRDYGILQQVQSKNVNDLAENRKYTQDLEDMYNEDTAKYTALQNHTNDKDPISYVKELEKGYSQADAKNQGRANTIRRQTAEIDSLNKRFASGRERAKQVLAQKDQTIGELQTHANSLDEQLGAANKSIDRMRRNASIGGAVGGAAIGGGVGYAGSNWLSNKLKLTGRKALAAKLLGTAAGTALGGAGGYYLGRNI